MIIRVKNLRLRTIIGIQDWERKKKQDIVINLEIESDGSAAAESDRIEDSVDYKSLTKKVIQVVESSKFHLLEKLSSTIASAIMENERVRRVRVEVDKPHALRFADSVSIESVAERPR